MKQIAGTLVVVALLAAVQQSPPSFHGFALGNGEWVVVDQRSGQSCRFSTTSPLDSTTSARYDVIMETGDYDQVEAQAIAIELSGRECRRMYPLRDQIGF